MFYRVIDILKYFPFKMMINADIMALSLLTALVFGMILTIYGAIKVQNCNYTSVEILKKQLLKTKKLLLLFFVIYIAKIALDIVMMKSICNSLEIQIDTAPQSADVYNKESNDPHIILVYKNSTTLYGEGYSKYIKQKTDLPSNDTEDSEEYVKLNYRSAQLSISNLAYFYKKDKILVLKIDLIKEHMQSTIIGVYVMVLIFNAVGFVSFCI